MKIYNKIIKKLITTIVLIVVLLNMLLSEKYSNVKATQEEILMNSSKTISNIFKYDNNLIENQYITYDSSKTEIPIYKLYIGQKDINNRNSILNSENENSSILWKTLQYGYPYISLEEMGVSNKDEAYTITQEAIYCVLNLRELSKYKSDKNENIIALNKIVNKAINNNKDYCIPNVEITEKSGFYKENINGTIYYTQKFQLNSNQIYSTYTVNVNNAPEDTKILDIYNNETSNFKTSLFKIAIPHKNIKDVLNLSINVQNINIDTFPLNYCSVNEENYCVVKDKSEKIEDKQFNFNKITNVSSIIAKVIFQNGKPKADAKIELKQNNNLILETITNNDGIATLNNLYPGRYEIYEKDINNMVVGNMPVVVDVLYNEQLNINVFNTISNENNIIMENEKKKGQVEIHLIDNENSSIVLNNSEIEILDVENNLVEVLKSNENGIAMSSRLPIDKVYRIKQKTTLEDYIIDLNFYRVEFKENDEIIVIEIKNSIKKNFIKITKIDKDNNDLRLEGVVFGIYNSENELIEEITTNNNGEAISSNLPINRAYYIKEIKALDNYVLDNKTVTVFLTETNNRNEEIKEINVNRLSKTGNCLVVENQKIYNSLPKFGC